MFKLTTSDLHHRITIAQLEPKSQVSKIEPQRDFQQCGISTNIDSHEPVQPPFKFRKSECCSVSSLTVIEYSSN